MEYSFKSALKITVLKVFVCMFFIACGNRNPNLSEKQLKTLMDNTSVKVAEPEPELPDTGYIPPVGARYAEKRSVDPASPPVTLSVTLAKGEKKKLKMSMFGKNVQYMTLRLPEESDFFLSETSIYMTAEKWLQNAKQTTKVHQSGNWLITEDVLGIRVFDMQGNFLRNLLLSEFDENTRTPEKIEIALDGYKQIMLSDIFNDYCFLASMENKKGSIPQTGYYSLPTGEFMMAPVRRLVYGKHLDHNSLFSFRGGIDNPLMALSFDSKGDTLCKFTNYVRRDKSRKGGITNPDKNFSFRSGNRFFFRQAYCDTIFRVQSSGRIVPAYCFDFGNYRVDLEDAIRANTQGKYIPWQFINCRNSAILIFTIGRDCPNCRKNGEVEFHCIQFDKQTGKPTVIDMQSEYPENILIENDIDNGLPLPLNYANTQNGNMVATFTKKQINSMIEKNSQNISPEILEKLKAGSLNLKQNEMLVMIVGD